MEAQFTTQPVIGEYYLQGVMETASGFQLNKDSSFQFYFSYGALDRFGEGQWTIKNDTVIFNSKSKRNQDFVLTQSSLTRANKITIQLKDMNEMLLRHVYCIIRGGGKEQEGMSDKTGNTHFELQPVESIELLFEFCPEKRSVFTISSSDHRLFEFKPEPWLMEVFFQNFSLKITEDGLEGGHPLSEKTSFFYRRNN